MTDVTSTRIEAQFSDTGDVVRSGHMTYDRSWNVVDFPPWRYTPHDGLGIQLPLAVGKTWSSQAGGVNGKTGVVERTSADSTVTAREAVVTRAGGFETYRITTTRVERFVEDPSRSRETKIETWYAPAVDRWVKRTIVGKINKLVVRSETLELTDYQRAP